MSPGPGPGGPASEPFGYRRVSPGDKRRLVDGVFDSVAARYDAMNDLMSLGAHRAWRRAALRALALAPGQRVLDLAAGSGAMAALAAPAVGPRGRVVAADGNAAMLGVGRDRLLDAGLAAVDFVRARAERLPFADAAFDRACVAFGLRNFTDQAAALAELRRTLAPGGRLVVLEFSRPRLGPLGPLYDAWSFGALPLLGRLVAGDAGSYRYLAESIRVHPDAAAVSAMLAAAGFSGVGHRALSGGIVALHAATRG